MRPSSLRALAAVLAAVTALLTALLTAACGKTDTAGEGLRTDPRSGPLLGPREPDRVFPAPVPRWDPPNAANGFEPVPVVGAHPPTPRSD